MVTVVVVEFGVMRCQPLRRALGTTWRVQCQYLPNRETKGEGEKQWENF